jgi:uroporphyrinogen-III decarboxylase
MTPRERFVASMTFQPADRCFLKPNGYSPLTIKRWEQEGLPKGVDPNEYFGMDSREFVRINMECYPGFPEKILEEDETYITKTDSEGITLKQFREDSLAAMPNFIDFPVKCRRDFERMKEQYQPDIEARYPANYERNVSFWNSSCTVPVAYELRGMPFFRIMRWMGLEGLCMAMYDDPKWVHEMAAFLENFLMTVCEKVLAEVKVDYVYGCDDIGYKTSSLISPAAYREFFFKPTQRIIRKVRQAGVPVIVMDSDGNMDEFAQIYIDAGFNTLIPVEVAAGNDLVAMRKQFGKQLAYQGGFDKRVLARRKEDIHREVMRLYPFMMASGGFAPNIDHAVPHDVPFENFRYYTELTKEIAENPKKYL